MEYKNCLTDKNKILYNLVAKILNVINGKFVWCVIIVYLPIENYQQFWTLKTTNFSLTSLHQSPTWRSRATFMLSLLMHIFVALFSDFLKSFDSLHNIRIRAILQIMRGDMSVKAYIIYLI